MWILPKQLHTSAYVLDTKELGLDSEEFSQISEKSLMWRSKPSLSRTWLQRWKRNTWIKRLSSRTLKPSLTNSFVERWTSSQAASLVNHSPLQESVKQLMTQGTSSHSSQMESESANLELFSSRTYKESLVVKPVTENQFSNMSSESWNKWVTEQRQEYSQRKKLALLTKEKESLSSATPQVTDTRTDVRMPSERSEKAKKGGCKNLREEVMQPQNWPTMTVKSGGGLPPNSQSKSKSRKQHAGHPLETAVMREPQNWPTPTSAEGTKIGNQPNFGQVGLSNHPSIVGRPDRAKLNKSGKSQESWATPRTSQAMSAKITENLVNREKGNLEEQKGKKSVGSRLNPNWVEQLMGLPVGWTQLPTEWTD